MSNQLYVTPTKFEDVRTGDVSYGVRVYDDYGNFYINHWESIPDDDLDILQMVIEEEADEWINMADWVVENHSSIIIGNVTYEWYEIKHILVEDDEDEE